jgi:diguanylate cyclase (GGDEF)-like protein
METKPFVEAYRGLNSSYFKLIDSLSALRALSSIAIQSKSDQELMDRALGVLVENQDLERCSIYILRDETLTIAAGMDWEDLISIQRGIGRAPHARDTEFNLGEGLVGIAAQTGELQHCRECTRDQRFLPRCKPCQPDAIAVSDEVGTVVGSIISVPISGGDDILGVLNVSHPHAGFFGEEHERTLRIFCNILGQLLVNNRFIHQMDELVQERTRQLQQALDDAEELKQRYEMLSVIDDLTQLHNRRFFFPETRAALARAVRYELPFSVLLIDVDHFKVVNDSFGHATGDVVLRQVAELIKRQIREGDILARFGGEEFILALPNTDQQGAMLLAERIRSKVKHHHWDVEGKPLLVTLSIGAAEVSDYREMESNKILDHLIMQADQALYFGKHNGRDQACAYADIACKL